MVIRKETKEEEEIKDKETDKEENQIPMIPNYLDLILGEVNAIRILLEKQDR